jgi:FG-GAP-like repeat
MGSCVATAVACLGVLATLGGGVGAARAADTPRFSRAVILELGFRGGLDPVRMSAGDLTGDGHADLASVQWTSATVAVLASKGTGGFAKRVLYATPRRPSGIAIADVDADGDQDIITASANPAGSVAIFANNGVGRLERLDTYATSRKAYAVAAADLDRDGALDLVTANFGQQHLHVLRGQGGGRFAVSGRYEGTPATDVALGDVNSDGNLDVALAAEREPGSLVVRLGNGDGSFGLPSIYGGTARPWGVTLADLNRDGHLDMAAASYSYDSVYVLINRDDGTFAARTKYAMPAWPGPDAVHVSDFDRDGTPDIATPSGNGPVVLRGRGDGTFSRPRPISRMPGQSGVVADFNNDGWSDLAFTFVGRGDSTSNAFALINWTAQPAPPCVVPDLGFEPFLGTPLRRAARILRSSGCRLGEVRRQHSRRVPKRQVISQTPRPNEVLPSNGAVDLVVSRGQRRPRHR